MYIRVYSPKGEPFDVPRMMADKLILQEGWTQQPFVQESYVTVEEANKFFEETDTVSEDEDDIYLEDEEETYDDEE